MKEIIHLLGRGASLCGLSLALTSLAADLEQGFLHPPDAARPRVYWFVMDGNLSREGITADFEAIKQVGLGGVLFMEVDVGIPKGPTKFMSPPWRALFQHANAEAARLGLEITMPASPGWTGSGGPWVKPEQSMQKLVTSETNLSGPRRFDGVLPAPPTVAGFYREVAVVAFPTPAKPYRIADLPEKAVYQRGHYSSEAGVKTLLPAPARYPQLSRDEVIAPDRLVVLSDKLSAEGRLTWDVPAGDWTVLRCGHTSTGANTRPAPEPGLGLECDKFDQAALEAHFNDFLGKLLADIGPLAGKSLVSLHIDSWEMGPQNWTARFPQEFQQRRGYDPLRYLPVMTGRVVESLEVSERFLWDLRQTILELISQNHAGHLAELAHQHGLGLSIEPYDGTPCDDMTYGARADVPMGEFWRDTFQTWFSCAEASSIAHTHGKALVQAEAFTSGDGERWLAHPGSLKTLGDWAFCAGINRFVFHRYAHQPWLDRWPGMTMGPYGIHYERTQTWWELSRAWIEYLTRCQFLLQQGLFVADVCFLTPEASPQVFRPPDSAWRGQPPERPGYNFDACTPETLLARATVKAGRLTLPDGMSYRLLALPRQQTITPALLRQIRQLAQAGATILGPRPLKSPSLSGFPQCDDEVKRLAEDLWPAAGETPQADPGSLPASGLPERRIGQGRIISIPGLDDKAAASETARNPLEKSRWIWFREGQPAAAAPVGQRSFRRPVVLERVTNLASARVFMTADNSFELWVNGHSAGTGNTFRQVFAMDVAAWLKPGTNLLAVRADNGGTAPNPAGLIGALVLRWADGRETEVPTDVSWQAAREPSGAWTTALTAGESWQPAFELGPCDMAPWGPTSPATAAPETFCDYSVVSRVLRGLGLPPDFETEAPFRYLHRRDGATDLYFVANREERWARAECAFRVTGKVPELWDPLTGRISRPAVYREKEGRTLLPLNLEPAGSVFVAFRDPAGKASQEIAASPVVAFRRNDVDLLPSAGGASDGPSVAELSRTPAGQVRLLARQAGRYEIETGGGRRGGIEIGALPSPLIVEGPWEVRFQPQRGAPEKLMFEALTDWSKHPDPGVKYFSGTADYARVLTIPAEMLAPGKRLFLDLGQVAVMARVRLNGQDLGILWKTPFTVEITAHAKAGSNPLEVTVVNLWPNRLIGDQSLPAAQRVAWTTWNPFRKDSPLLESGLLGPVTLRTAEEREIPVAPKE